MGYIKQLDTLRALAVFLVIIGHWLPPSNPVNILPNGFIGVTIFFVLSGFLITGILIENRHQATLSKTSTATVLKNFYIRRTLRIFPVYYLSIFILFLFSKNIAGNVTTAAPYLLSYTTNFYIFSVQNWEPNISHLWSLAVEEQFYLVWPWLILFISRKYLLWPIAAFIFTGIVCQYFTMHLKMYEVLTFNCFDAFGMGALLSWQMHFNPLRLNRFYRNTSVAAVLAAPLFIFSLKKDFPFILPPRTCISIMSLWAVTGIIVYRHSTDILFKYLLNNRVLIAIGKISYGIYLYHNILPNTLNKLLLGRYIDMIVPDSLLKKYWGWLFVAENAVIVITVSWLSYILVEKRFLLLKKYFTYNNKSKIKTLPAGQEM